MDKESNLEKNLKTIGIAVLIGAATVLAGTGLYQVCKEITNITEKYIESNQYNPLIQNK